MAHVEFSVTDDIRDHAEGVDLGSRSGCRWNSHDRKGRVDEGVAEVEVEVALRIAGTECNSLRGIH